MRVHLNEGTPLSLARVSRTGATSSTNEVLGLVDVTCRNGRQVRRGDPGEYLAPVEELAAVDERREGLALPPDPAGRPVRRAVAGCVGMCGDDRGTLRARVVDRRHEACVERDVVRQPEREHMCRLLRLVVVVRELEARDQDEAVSSYRPQRLALDLVDVRVP